MVPSGSGDVSVTSPIIGWSPSITTRAPPTGGTSAVWSKSTVPPASDVPDISNTSEPPTRTVPSAGSITVEPSVPSGNQPTTSTMRWLVPWELKRVIRPRGADLDDGEVGDGLAFDVVEVAGVGGGDAGGVGGDPAARGGGLGDGDVDDHGADAGGGDAAVAGDGEVAGGAGAEGGGGAGVEEPRGVSGL